MRETRRMCGPNKNRAVDLLIDGGQLCSRRGTPVKVFRRTSGGTTTAVAVSNIMKPFIHCTRHTIARNTHSLCFYFCLVLLSELEVRAAGRNGRTLVPRSDTTTTTVALVDHPLSIPLFFYRRAYSDVPLTYRKAVNNNNRAPSSPATQE